MPKHAVIAEDEPLIADVVSWTLEEQGYTVQIAYDGQSALELVRQATALDLLVTDIRMPGGMDGWALATAARALRSDLPIVYMTGYSPDPPGAVSQSAMLRKPFPPDDLVAVIRQFNRERDDV